MIDPCGCEESEDLTMALKAIKNARQEFDLADGADWERLVERIDNVVGVLDAYAFARTKP